MSERPRYKQGTLMPLRDVIMPADLLAIQAMTPLKAGELVVVTKGNYSDFDVMTLARASKDIDVSAELLAWLATATQVAECDDDWPLFEAFDFLAHLVTTGALEEITCRELHLPDRHDSDWAVYDMLPAMTPCAACPHALGYHYQDGGSCRHIECDCRGFTRADAAQIPSTDTATQSRR